MTNPNPENPKSSAEELRDRRHRQAVESGSEHFPSHMRYDVALDALERTLAGNPGKGILDLMDSLAKLYEYQSIVRKDSSYRHPELLAEIETSLAAAQNALTAGDTILTPVERELALITLSLSQAQEYLQRFHVNETDRDKNFGLSQHNVRMAIERIIKAFDPPSP